MQELNRPTDVGEKAKQGFWEEFEVPDFVLWPEEGRQKGAGRDVGWVLGPLGERWTSAEASSALPDAAAAGMPAPVPPEGGTAAGEQAQESLQEYPSL